MWQSDRAVPELRQLALEPLELGDLFVDVGGPLLDELGHVCAGRFAGVAQGQDLSDLAEGEAKPADAADEAQTLLVAPPVAAVADTLRSPARREPTGQTPRPCRPGLRRRREDGGEHPEYGHPSGPRDRAYP